MRQAWATQRWMILMLNLGQGTLLQEVLRIDHCYRLPDGQDFVSEDPMATDVLPEKQVLQCILHHRARSWTYIKAFTS